MFDHRREHPFYGICRRTGGEPDHTVAKTFSRRSAMPPFDPYWSRPLGNGASARVPFRPPPLPDIGRSFGRSDASRIDTAVPGDIVDFAARSPDIHQLPVT